MTPPIATSRANSVAIDGSFLDAAFACCDFLLLDQRRPRYRMFLCGARKAYLCHSGDFDFCDGRVRNYLGAHLLGAGISAAIHCSTHAFDDGCFPTRAPEQDPGCVGLDRDAAGIPR